MFEVCLSKQNVIKEEFKSCTTADARYQKIIELGKRLPPLDDKYKISDNIVKGCQSIVYLHSELVDGLVHFQVASDALISAGLAAMLVRVYDGESPETILKCPPTYLDELGIAASLSPNRANGLYSMHLRMKKDALHLLMQKSK